MVVVAILSANGIALNQSTPNPLTEDVSQAVCAADGVRASIYDIQDKKDLMFDLVCGIPAVCAVLQLLIWSTYSLRSAK